MQKKYMQKIGLLNLEHMKIQKNFTNIINIKDKKNIIYADKAHHDKDKTLKRI